MHEAVLSSPALNLEPAQFDKRWKAGGSDSLTYKDLAAHKQQNASVLGELLQMADGILLPLQPRYQQQAAQLMDHGSQLWKSAPGTIQAAWAHMRGLGLTDSEVAALIRQTPGLLKYNWSGTIV